MRDDPRGVPAAGCGDGRAGRCAGADAPARPPRVLAALSVSLIALSAQALHAEDVTLIVADTDSLIVHRGIDGVEFAPGVTVRAFCLSELEGSAENAAFAEGSSVIAVDVMDDRNSAWVRDRSLLAGREVYALRGSADDERLRAEGFVFDGVAYDYFYQLTPANVANAVRRLLSLRAVPGLAYGPREELPALGVYHPGAPGDGTFPTAEGYVEWYRTTPSFSEGAPWVALMFFEAFLAEQQRDAVGGIVRAMEGEGLNVMPAFGSDLPVLERILMDGNRKARVDAVASFSLKFYLSYAEGMREALDDLGVPVFNAINLYTQTIEEWRESPRGIPALDVVWNLDNPETSGVAEPNVVMGKVEEATPGGSLVFRYGALEAEARHMARRIRRHLELGRKPPAERRVALLYYNNSRGKQSIGAAFLNVFRSIAGIAGRLAAEGYSVELDPPLDEERVKSLVLRGGRNIGAWAPGELDAMIGQGDVVLWPVQEYRRLFDGLPEEYREKVLAQWGPPEGGGIMVRDGKLVLPVILLGNLAIMPQGARGAEDDPVKLYHDPLIYPHHQYLALYLWLEHVWKADAVIHLGTHGTLEWMPGKQSGLSLSDPGEILMGTLPDLYPYNMDVVAEGLQAKRRGRAIVVDHLIPPLVTAGAYQEYERLGELIASYEGAVRNDADTAEGYLAQIAELVGELALDKDLHLPAGDGGGDAAGGGGAGDGGTGDGGAAAGARWRADGPEAVRRLSEYLEYLETADVPYGLHTFGVPPSGEAADSLLGVMSRENPGLDVGDSRERLAVSGRREMDALVKGLAGGRVLPGEGNDPARNPEALPTGRNFYGISPGRLPTREAWRLGQLAADGIIRDYLAGHGEYPDKVAVVVWAVEALRNEGVNESTVLALVGVEPVWAPSGLVTGTRPIPGRILGRPRIDVTIDASGLYRDLFPDRAVFLDNAIRQAALQDDVENFIARGDARNLEALMARGFPEGEARRFSRARIFSERLGAYGNRVPETVSASGLWEDPNDVALAFREHTGYAYGAELWGEPARDALELNLAGSKVAWHSLSSHLFGIMDDDDFNGYLGGLAMAITSLSEGRAPDTVVTDQRAAGRVAMTPLDTLIGQETRTRYLNPTWIEGMKAEGYAGAGEMAKFVEYLFAFQVTVPQDVDPRLWDQTYAVYVEDKYGEDLPGFLDRENPWAFQSITGRLLETARKGYWSPSEEARRRLAVDYATSVIERGIACCDHTCNNPLFHQMVMGIVSLPGVMAPELVERFRVAVEEAGRKPLEEQVAERLDLIRDLGLRRAELDSNPARTGPAPEAAAEAGEARPADGPEDRESDAESVKGLRMERMDNPAEDTSLSSSGVEWTLSAFVLAMLAVFFLGFRRRARRAGRGGGRGGPVPGGGAGGAGEPGAGYGEPGGGPGSGEEAGGSGGGGG
ncbi:MAG: cobaltochelatase subunit CobN [Deltaproteobacteria bacterium]|jgi:cobaltochelatase CobN|nr:cobaltochelatase subunit CobN [Deltaproteobacteria bacterium]